MTSVLTVAPLDTFTFSLSTCLLYTSMEQGKVLNEELKRDIKEKVKETVTVQVVKEAPEGDILSQVDSMSREDRQALKEKLAAMEDADEAAEGDAADGE